ncbi:serine/arginine repetitive matrix protein 1-like isoform X2 [Palaemon carinicauda]|uniref:serine/arginine repetitive matrix protein 1-like isoform X2 n=1 Tax=Palaemon carinicauda TaxID=392227 RepID=UPI0035B6035E
MVRKKRGEEEEVKLEIKDEPLDHFQEEDVVKDNSVKHKLDGQKEKRCVMDHARRCPGPRAGKSCGAFLSKPDVDPHSLCSSCRGKVCSPSDTCPECASWSEVQWVKFRTKKKKTSKRSPRKASFSSPATSAGEKLDRVPSSPTQSRGRGKSVKGKKPVLLPQECLLDSGVTVSVQASGGPEGMFFESPRDVALVQGGHVSAGDPMWNKNVPFSSPDSWVVVSGTSAAEGAPGKEDSPLEDPLGWSLPRTPCRSPRRVEDGLGSCFQIIEHPTTPPAASSAVPEVFLQPSTSETQQVLSKAPPAPRSRYREMPESSAAGSSFSSEEEVRRKHRRRRDRSRRRRSYSRSPSRSRHSRRRSRSPQQKVRRSSSPNEQWVLVPCSKLKDLTTVTGTAGRLTGDSPPRRASDSCKSATAMDHRSSSERRKTARKETQSAQRRESPLRTCSRDESARGSDRRARLPPSNIPTEELVHWLKDQRTAEAPVSSKGRSLDPHRSAVARFSATSHPRTEEAVDDSEGVPAKDSAYRKVINLIRKHHRIKEPIPSEEDVWRSGLNRIMEEPVQKKPSLALPEARDVKLGRVHIDKVVARNRENSKGQSASKLLQGLKSQSKYYSLEGRPHGASKLEDSLEVMGQGSPEDGASSAPIYFSQAEAVMMEEMSKDLINVASWLDWWASTLVGTQISTESADPSKRDALKEFISSGGRALKFLTFQSLALSANWVLRRRDSVLKNLSKKIPDREARTLRNLSVWDEGLFPLKETEEVVEKLAKRKETIVPKSQPMRRPAYRRPAPEAPSTSRSSPTQVRREPSTSLWSQATQPTRRGTSSAPTSSRTTYPSARRGHSGRSS